MSQASVEHQLVELETQYWKAIQDSDIETMMALTDDSCIVAGAQGIAQLDNRDLGKVMERATYRLNDFQIKDPRVRLLRDDVAIVAYKVTEDLTVDGAPVRLESADASTWMRRDGRWRCVLHTESVAGDPYGRDRHA